jgi:hypothetical protein
MTDPLLDQSEPLVVADPENLTLPEGQRFFLDDSMFPLDKRNKPVPTFKVKEVAEVFFGKSVDWLRWRMRPDDKRVKDKVTGEITVIPGDHPDGFFILDEQPMDFKRTGPGARYFTLADIERMAVALAQGGHIDGARLALVIRMVVTCARLHGVIV